MWRCGSVAAGGGGRTLRVSAGHAGVLAAQPLGAARLSAHDEWMDVPGLRLALPRRSQPQWYDLQYMQHVRPDAPPNGNPLVTRDVLSMRLLDS